jgi:hypothetical protein
MDAEKIRIFPLAIHLRGGISHPVWDQPSESANESAFRLHGMQFFHILAEELVLISWKVRRVIWGNARFRAVCNRVGHVLFYLSDLSPPHMTRSKPLRRSAPRKVICIEILFRIDLLDSRTVYELETKLPRVCFIKVVLVILNAGLGYWIVGTKGYWRSEKRKTIVVHH